MIENLDSFTNYLGANRYQAQSMCLTSDFVLVKMYTILYGISGFCAIFLGLVMFLTYRNSSHMLRVAIVLLKDPWILKLFSFYLIARGLYDVSSITTIHFAVYYSDLMILAALSGISLYSVWRVLTVVFDKERHENILDELVPGGVPDYDFQPTPEGNATVRLPLTHYNNPKVPAKTTKQRENG